MSNLVPPSSLTSAIAVLKELSSNDWAPGSTPNKKGTLELHLASGQCVLWEPKHGAGAHTKGYWLRVTVLDIGVEIVAFLEIRSFWLQPLQPPWHACMYVLADPTCSKERYVVAQ